MRAERASLAAASVVAQDRQRLVAVAGEDELHRSARRVCPARPRRRRIALAAAHARTAMRAGARRADCAAMRATYARAPPFTVRHCGRSRRPQQAVVVAEAREARSGKSQDVAARRGPYRAGHRQQVPVAKPAAVALAIEIARRARSRASSSVGEQRRRAVIEARDVGEHAMEGGPHQVRRLGEHGAEMAAGPFDAVAVDAAGERHVRGHARDTERRRTAAPDAGTCARCRPGSPCRPGESRLRASRPRCGCGRRGSRWPRTP